MHRHSTWQMCSNGGNRKSSRGKVILGGHEARWLDNLDVVETWHYTKYRFDNHLHYRNEAPPPTTHVGGKQIAFPYPSCIGVAASSENPGDAC